MNRLLVLRQLNQVFVLVYSGSVRYMTRKNDRLLDRCSLMDSET